MIGPVPRSGHAILVLALAALVGSPHPGMADEARAPSTYRPEVLGRVGVVAAGRQFAAEAGMQMLMRGGNAIDAGVAATFAASVTEISHFGLGGEVPIILYLADRRDVVVISGQGVAPAAASPSYFRRLGEIPRSGPLAGTGPAVVAARGTPPARIGTASLSPVLAPGSTLAGGGVSWYRVLTPR